MKLHQNNFLRRLLVCSGILLTFNSLGLFGNPAIHAKSHHISTYSINNHHLFSYHQMYSASRMILHNHHSRNNSNLKRRINNTIVHNMYHYRYYQIKHILHSIIPHILNNSNRKKFRRYYSIRRKRNAKIIHDKDIKFDREVSSELFKDINNIRKKHHLKPLREWPVINQVAKLRAKQVYHAYNTIPNNIESATHSGNIQGSDNWIHGMDTHQTSDDDAKKLGIKQFLGLGENAGAICIGTFHKDGDPEGDKPYTSYDYTPKQIADNDIRSMMYYDRFSRNGHRNNILNPHATGMGIGVYYLTRPKANQNSYAQIYGGMVQEYSIMPLSKKEQQ